VVSRFGRRRVPLRRALNQPLRVHHSPAFRCPGQLRGGNADCDADADRHTHADVGGHGGANGDGDTDKHPGRHPDSDTNPNVHFGTDGDGHLDADPDADAGANRNADADRYLCANPGADTDGYDFTNANPDGHSHADPGPNPNQDSHASGDASTHHHADADAHGDADTHTNRYANRAGLQLVADHQDREWTGAVGAGGHRLRGEMLRTVPVRDGGYAHGDTREGLHLQYLERNDRRVFVQPGLHRYDELEQVLQRCVRCPSPWRPLAVGGLR